MKKRESCEKAQIVQSNSPNVMTSTADENSIIDALRSENLQLLEDKLSQEQPLNKLNLELTLLKEHQTKTEDYESIQEQLLQTTKENQENVDRKRQEYQKFAYFGPFLAKFPDLQVYDFARNRQADPSFDA